MHRPQFGLLLRSTMALLGMGSVMTPLLVPIKGKELPKKRERKKLHGPGGVPIEPEIETRQLRRQRLRRFTSYSHEVRIAPAPKIAKGQRKRVHGVATALNAGRASRLGRQLDRDGRLVRVG